MNATAPRKRIAARMFLLDADDRILLVHDRLDLDSQDSHWITPGGGVEGTESLPETAVRELYEETGLRVPLPAEAQPVYVEREVYWFAGQHIDQLNHYFLARLPVDAPTTVAAAAPTRYETAVALGTRWWSLPELESSGVVRVPGDMVGLIRKALAVE